MIAKLMRAAGVPLSASTGWPRLTVDQTLTIAPAPLDRVRDGQPGAAATAMFALSLATLLGAWFFQYVLGYLPCHLCLQERIPYYVIIPLSLVVALAVRTRAPRAWLGFGLAILGIAALCGVALGTYHAGVEWGFWPGPTDCTGTLWDLKSGGSLYDQLDSIHIVPCDKAAWRFLGISLAGYNALISLAMAGFASFGLVSAKKAGLSRRARCA
jgi:disulfide bond formation protein DsbB